MRQIGTPARPRGMRRRENLDHTLPFDARSSARPAATAGSTERKLLAGFAAVVVVVLTVVALAIWSSNRNARARAEVTRSTELLAKLEETLSTMQDVETGGRGYVITGRDEFLEPYQNGVAHIEDRLRELRSLAENESEQRASVDVLAAQIAERARAS